MYQKNIKQCLEQCSGFAMKLLKEGFVYLDELAVVQLLFDIKKRCMLQWDGRIYRHATC